MSLDAAERRYMSLIGAKRMAKTCIGLVGQQTNRREIAAKPQSKDSEYVHAHRCIAPIARAKNRWNTAPLFF